MPNRVEGTAPGLQPATQRPEAVRTGQNAAQPADTAANTNQTDRVEISQAGQTRNREMQAANAGGNAARGAALNAPGARPPQAGEQGNIEQTTQRNAEQLRQQQQQAAQPPPQRGPQPDAGHIVDITG